MTPTKDMINSHEAAEFLGITVGALRNKLCKDMKFKNSVRVYRIGRLMFNIADLIAYRDNCQIVTSEEIKRVVFQDMLEKKIQANRVTPILRIGKGV